MKTAWLPVVIACLFLASCATMNDAKKMPVEGPCKEMYERAEFGEGETVAGTWLMIIGGISATVGGSILGSTSLNGKDGNPDLLITGATLVGSGLAMVIVGGVLLSDGRERVKEWNGQCVGATAAERYCLFEPLSEQKQ